LKSALANIGANGLSQTAALLEKAGREADWPAIHGELPSFREELAVLVTRIGEITASARSGNNETQAEPDIGEALARLREALEAKDFDTVDSVLARLQALPLTGKMRQVVSEISDLVLTADFQKAAAALTDLSRQND
jgi:HPt (histidine-containing phosphotransfer) domain-containing protein